MRETIRKAFVDSIPIMAGYVFIGIGFGIIMEDKGMGIWWVLAMCILIYSGAMQFVTINLITGGASFIASAITALMVSCRHLFYAISMIDGYKGSGLKKPYLIYALTDETYSLVCRDNLPEGMNKHTYSFLLSLFNQSYWVIGCIIGSLAGTLITFSTEGIDFAMTALFVSIFTEQWFETKDKSSALTGVGVSLLCLILFGPQRFLIPTMIGITIVLTLIEKLRARRNQITPFEPARVSSSVSAEPACSSEPATPISSSEPATPVSSSGSATPTSSSEPVAKGGDNHE